MASQYSSKDTGIVVLKEGDLVRFALWGEFDYTDDWSKAEKNHVGTLIHYDKLMKTATVLYEGRLHKVRSQLIEKSGKKDLEKYHESR